MSDWRSDFGSLAAPLLATIQGSQLVAQLTGNGDRYAAMHAPPPHISRTTSHIDGAALLMAARALKPVVRVGVPDHVIMPPLSALNPHHRRLDPLAMRRSFLPSKAESITPANSAIEPLHSLLTSVVPTTSQKTHGIQPAQRHQKAGAQPMTSSALGTGIEHWWTYEERAIPGVGKAMLNVGTGNLVVSAMDVDIPERGIDLAFQRVYNMQSLHDYNGDDGGDRAIFGNLWTNDLDANMVYDSTANTITVYDIDGTACVYTSNGDGTWKPCAGEYATLVPTDAPADCTYAWTKKSGTVYWFHTDAGGGGCGLPLAKKGHLQEILGRNNNNNITFTYSYDASGKGPEDITEIDANHSDGHELIMKFGSIPGTSINELSTITRPDGAILQYSYDTSGNLLRVDKPGNNTPTPSAPQNTPPVPTGDLPETYAYASGTSALQEACGPRCTISNWNHPGNPDDGAAILFSVDGSLRLANWQVQGKLNFTPSDGTNTVLQSGFSTAFQAWNTEYFVYGASTSSPCGSTTSGATTMCDTDGHSTIWTTNSASSVTQTQEWTGSSEATWLVTSASWNAQNELTSMTDANSNTTKYGYDDTGSGNGSGNMVEMQLPYTGDIVGGSLKPTSYYSYDQFNNVTAYCDPVYNASHGNGWVSQPTDILCPSSNGTTYFTYNTGDSVEPYGRLTDMYTPMQYHRQITYNQSIQGGDFGLPTQVQGGQVTQYDSSTRTPTQDFGYDGYGNLATYDRGSGGGVTEDSWTIAYGSLNLATKRTENDTTINPSGINSYSCHYPDGTLLYTETPSQNASDGHPACPSTATLLQGSFSPPANATSYRYDADGDQIEIFTHKGCSTATPCPAESSSMACSSGEVNPIGTTCNYYDGLDRVVDVVEPYDSRTIPNTIISYELYGFKWLTRYIYDLSQSGGSANLKISDNTGTISNLVAYGGLYKTQECLPQNKVVSSPQSTCSWSDVRGSSLDAKDRLTNKYELAFGVQAQVANTYDTNGNSGLLSEVKNAIGQKTDYSYDALNKVKQITFTGTAPLADNRAYQYDANGRPATSQNSLGTLTNTYDLDGNKISVAEPAQQSAASLICYYYYGDGLREYVSIGPVSVGGCNGIVQNMNPGNGGISQPRIFSYAYRLDGKLTMQHVNWSVQSDFIWTYAPSGRELTMADPLTGQSVTGPGGAMNFAKKSYSYDQNGRVTQLNLPEGYQESSIAYDTDGEATGYTASSNGTSYARQLTLNARGELLMDNLPGTQFGWAQGPTSAANGTLFGDGNVGVPGGPGDVVQAPPTTLEFDARSGMVLESTDPQWAEQWVGNDFYTYDAAGRKIARTGSGPSTTAYDAENHFQTGNVTNGPLAASAQWGPDGHERVDSIYDVNHPQNPPIVNTAHWDDDWMLFDTSTAANGLSLYVSKLGSLDQYGDWTIVDRDQTGIRQTSHGIGVSPNFPPTGTWYGGWSVGSTRTVTHIKQNIPYTYFIFLGSCGGTLQNGVQQGNCPASGPAFDMSRTDGYGMASGINQGARSYDSVSGQWSTPDAYAGTVLEPMSQKPFMWNNNNPIAWSDPTGFYVFAQAMPADEREEYAYFASQLDKKVTDKLSDPNLSPTERQALQQLHGDLQPGRGSWVIGFGSTHPGSNAESVPRLTTAGQFGVPAISSIFNTKTLNTEASAEYVKAIATEGGTYEIASGHMGSELQAQALHIYKTQASGPLGDLTNRYFTEPLGLGRDTMPSTPLTPP